MDIVSSDLASNIRPFRADEVLFKTERGQKVTLSLYLKLYEKQLYNENLSENTIAMYSRTVQMFYEQFGTITKGYLMAWKGMMLEKYKPATVNLRIIEMNRFLKYCRKYELCLRCAKIQQKFMVDNVISIRQYTALKEKLKRDGHTKAFFAIWILGSTGVRVSELVSLRIRDLYEGQADIYSKGGKYRHIFIPSRLCKEAIKWVESEGRTDGSLFLNNHGETISTRGIERMVKYYGTKYHIDPCVLHPHSFRHMFAIEFLKKRPNELTLLADLLGHQSLDTTRLYLHRSSVECRNLFERTVSW